MRVFLPARQSPLFLFAALLVLAQLRGVEEGGFYYQPTVTPRTDSVVLASDASAQVLSPELRLAVSNGDEFKGVNLNGSVFYRSRKPALEGALLGLKGVSRIAKISTLDKADGESAQSGRPAELVVRTKGKPSAAQLSALRYNATQVGLKVSFDSAERDFLVLSRRGGIPAELIQRLPTISDQIVHIAPNHLVKLCSDQVLESASGSNSAAVLPQWGMERINAPELWKRTGGFALVGAAVIDSGVDARHEDLNPNIACRDVTVKLPFADTAVDLEGHGTHCIGTISAVGDNDRGIAGVNWHAQILAVRAFGEENGTTIPIIADALDEVIRLKDKYNIKVINASWELNTSDEILEAKIRKVSDAGILVVAAAGNAGRDLDEPGYCAYPAGYPFPGVIAVMAMDMDNERHKDSNFGLKTIHMAAPGLSIISTRPTELGFPPYVMRDKTSVAAPFVTGMAVALWTIGYETLARLPSQEALARVKRTLLAMVQETPDLRDKCITHGYIRYDERRLSLLYVGSNEPDNPALVPPPRLFAVAEPLQVPPRDIPTSRTSIGRLPARAPGLTPGRSVTIAGRVEKMVSFDSSGPKYLVLTDAGSYEVEPQTKSAQTSLDALQGKQVEANVDIVPKLGSAESQILVNSAKASLVR